MSKAWADDDCRPPAGRRQFFHDLHSHPVGIAATHGYHEGLHVLSNTLETSDLRVKDQVIRSLQYSAPRQGGRFLENQRCDIQVGQGSARPPIVKGDPWNSRCLHCVAMAKVGIQPVIDPDPYTQALNCFLLPISTVVQPNDLIPMTMLRQERKRRFMGIDKEDE